MCDPGCTVLVLVSVVRLYLGVELCVRWVLCSSTSLASYSALIASFNACISAFFAMITAAAAASAGTLIRARITFSRSTSKGTRRHK